MVEEQAHTVVQSTTSGSPKSALRSGSDGNGESRVDAAGNVIQKGGSHHMTFVDTSAPGTPIMEVREVAAYKNSQPGCGCTIS
mmetsp:Transcript_19895/g.56481  ORF Transcript_19895/g.56481 Transcript_19895/m.56481 type:complete len:83 (+) Transcript_19895:113-361(+)